MNGHCIVVRELLMAVSKPNQRLKRDHLLLARREAIIHSQLCHPNVLPFWGLYQEDEGSVPHSIFPFVERGSLEDLLANFEPGQMMQLSDLIEILVGTARGVSYLHSRKPPVIHGDIHPGNILIGETGSPLLCDFGRSRIRHEVSRKSEREEGGRARFLAPELSGGQTDQFSPTQESDVFALAMTFLNAWSGEPPFPGIKNALQVSAALSIGERPTRPAFSVPLDPASNNDFWALLVDMWAQETAKRPSSNKVLKRVEGIFGQWQDLPSETVAPLVPFLDPGPELAFHWVFFLTDHWLCGV
ncbi:kinase-like protein [Clavulina sp. PMI_390]|nr:kinase-like protein [Clavulina sp. PMI_390]